MSARYVDLQSILSDQHNIICIKISNNNNDDIIKIPLNN